MLVVLRERLENHGVHCPGGERVRERKGKRVRRERE